MNTNTITIQKQNPETEKIKAIALEILRKHKKAFKELAK